MEKIIEEMQVEFYKILSIAINMAKINDKDLIPYMEEQRKIIQEDLSEDKKEELERLPNTTSSNNY